MRNHPWLLGYALLFVYITAIGGWGYKELQADDRAIIDNRIEASRDGCRQRNAERRVFRAQINDQIDQTRVLSPEVFEVFGLTRGEALDTLRERRSKLPALDCAEFVAPLRELNGD